MDHFRGYFKLDLLSSIVAVFARELRSMNLFPRETPLDLSRCFILNSIECDLVDSEALWEPQLTLIAAPEVDPLDWCPGLLQQPKR